MSSRVSSSASLTRLSRSFDIATPHFRANRRNCKGFRPAPSFRARSLSEKIDFVNSAQRFRPRRSQRACKPAQNQQYTRCGPLLGGFVFFGNRFASKAFVPVWMQMARVKQEQDLFETERSFRLLVE